jgi:hypothetical protein
VYALTGDRFQLLWVTNHDALLKEAQAAGDIEPTLPGLVRTPATAVVTIGIVKSGQDSGGLLYAQKQQVGCSCTTPMLHSTSEPACKPWVLAAVSSLSQLR